MYVPFNELPDSARIWIYQSDKPLTSDQIEKINNELKIFCDEWTAHSAKLSASFTIKYEHFIVLAVDESLNDATGCSIDRSVNIIKKIEQNLGLNLMNREMLAFFIKDQIVIISLKELKSYIISKKINSQSIFFNNLAISIADLAEGWMVESKKTWLNKYFNR